MVSKRGSRENMSFMLSFFFSSKFLKILIDAVKKGEERIKNRDRAISNREIESRAISKIIKVNVSKNQNYQQFSI